MFIFHMINFFFLNGSLFLFFSACPALDSDITEYAFASDLGLRGIKEDGLTHYSPSGTVIPADH